MKTCWQILEIESTTQTEIIRQAYLAHLPLYHPENDPQGFKELRQAYEEALRWAVNPDEKNADNEEDLAEEHEILKAFRTLLVSESERFQPSAWQKFIQQLNTYNMEDVDQLRWPLCVIAMESQYLSLNCASLLAERLNWYAFNDGEEMDEEEREAFLEAIQSGDCFDFLSLQEYPVALQNQTIEYYFALERCCRYHPEYVIPFLAIEGPWFVPDDAKLHRKLLRWYSSVQTGMAELLPVAEQWQVEAPDNEDARYYYCAQRLYCGEGESLIADLCAYWQSHPSTQADNLLLQWSQQHCPDYFALLVMVIEARSMVDEQGKSLKYVPGESARTRLLWAEILHSGKLSPLGQSFIESLFYKRKAWAWWKSRVNSETEEDSPLLDLYRVAEQVVLEAFPKQEMLARLNARREHGDAHPLEAIITCMLLTKVKLEPTDEDGGEPIAEKAEEKNDESEKTQSIASIIKVSLMVLVIGYAIGKIVMLFS
ncbi:J domain-containing protein [Escherichia albertii]|uniref:J domain-containing protein n=1 Tax=Escherichia albertii TaxID=208962 RepID=UPI000743DA71|nr:J domain-containing protein [Escherichia albertii]EFB1500480.1 J domain-containing protein [Escherichia albertii]EJM0808423.1 J domain-containing protein [Escherichia albertii]EJM1768170.1 J domain-containing protein [Escherichia albertii]EJM2113025.1 J domain-containing protein [Escherichia albertii]EJO0118759.1 J domain-containing protein [Escherichia albertii]